MTNVLVLLILIFCILAYTGQTFFSKLFSMRYRGPGAAATPVYAVIYCGIAGLIILLLAGFRYKPSPGTVIFGLLNGTTLFLYLLSLLHSSRLGPFSFNSIVLRFGGIVVCLLFAVMYWGDQLTISQISGIAVMLVAFIVFNSGGIDFSSVKKGYIFWVVMLFCSNGLYGVILDAQRRLYAAERNEMIVTTFLSSAVLSLIYLLFTERKQTPICFQMGKPAWIFAVEGGISAGFAAFTLMILLARIPSYVLYTIYNGAVLVLVVILCRIVLKESITKMTVVGILLSTLSIFLLSL